MIFFCFLGMLFVFFSFSSIFVFIKKKKWWGRRDDVFSGSSGGGGGVSLSGVMSSL